MFNELIERFGSTLGLSPKEAIQSELIKKLCSDLINGQVVVINSKQKKPINLNINEVHQNSAETLNDSDR
ncbi:MAG: hypothetical protein P8P49_01490 [Opitutales bacterium]|nr:hypothetical protein [Opitutales bacterium]MDG1324409.1 hypothetical protein [Opitutales bacterium]